MEKRPIFSRKRIRLATIQEGLKLTMSFHQRWTSMQSTLLLNTLVRRLRCIRNTLSQGLTKLPIVLRSLRCQRTSTTARISSSARSLEVYSLQIIKKLWAKKHSNALTSLILAQSASSIRSTASKRASAKRKRRRISTRLTPP